MSDAKTTAGSGSKDTPHQPLGFASDTSTDTKGIAETEALIDLWIEPDFSGLPGPYSEIQREIECLATARAGIQTLRPR